MYRIYIRSDEVYIQSAELRQRFLDRRELFFQLLGFRALRLDQLRRSFRDKALVRELLCHAVDLGQALVALLIQARALLLEVDELSERNEYRRPRRDYLHRSVVAAGVGELDARRRRELLEELRGVLVVDVVRVADYDQLRLLRRRVCSAAELRRALLRDVL